MLSNEFILGLIAGEGSFHVVLESPSRQRPKFTMNIHEDEILDEICEHLDLGGISRSDDIRAEWQIQSKAEIVELRDWVEDNMCQGFKQSDKYRQFKLWSEAVDIVPNDREPIGQDKRKRLVEIAYEIPKSDTRRKSKESWLEDVSDKQIFFCEGENSDGSECENRVSSPDKTCRWH